MAHEGPRMNRRAPRFPSDPESERVTGARGTLTVTVAEFRIADEGARTRLIGDISCLLREPAIPDSARSAGLELIGWLARRMPGEAAHALGVPEALQAQRTGRRKAR